MKDEEMINRGFEFPMRQYGDLQTRIVIRDMATQIALNFVGQTISSSDGSYTLLIDLISQAITEGVTPAWSKECPTEPGYYWIRNHKGSHDTDIVEIFRHGDEQLRILFLGDDNSYRLSESGSPEWQGPITPGE